MKFARAGRQSERGTALIEFALLLPFLLVLTVCVVDFGRAFYTKNVLATAVREGVRHLAANGWSSQDDAIARVEEVAEAAGVTVTNVTVVPVGTTQASVTANYEFDWLYPGLLTWMGVAFSDPMPLTATAVMHMG